MVENLLALISSLQVENEERRGFQDEWGKVLFGDVSDKIAHRYIYEIKTHHLKKQRGDSLGRKIESNLTRRPYPGSCAESLLALQFGPLCQYVNSSLCSPGKSNPSSRRAGGRGGRVTEASGCKER
jgi:hypothetical protein